MTPSGESPNTFHMSANGFKLESLGQDLTGKEIKQYWIIEDYEALIGEIKKFRTESSSLYGGQHHKGQKGIKVNLSLKWVDFYRQMINIRLFELHSIPEISSTLPKLSEIVMAMTPEGSIKTEKEDHLSEGSESELDLPKLDTNDQNV